jgi:hypothetical protein
MKLSNLMLKLTKPLLTRAESEAIAVFRLNTKVGTRDPNWDRLVSFLS